MGENICESADFGSVGVNSHRHYPVVVGDNVLDARLLLIRIRIRKYVRDSRHAVVGANLSESFFPKRGMYCSGPAI